jgi:hypothetical protein
MDKKLLSVAGTLVAILVIVMGAVLVVGNMLGNERFPDRRKSGACASFLSALAC